MNNILAQQIQKLRTEHNLSQAELASKIFVSRQAVSKWESGQSEPGIDKLILLTEVFGVRLDQLVLGNAGDEHPLLNLRHINKQFERPVLQDLNLTIQSNSRTALLGNNGAGKSTLIKVITGELQADAGKVESFIDNRDDLDFMPQETVLVPTLTVWEQLKLQALIKQVYDVPTLIDWLKRFDLINQKDHAVETLSGGQKRRLALLLSLLRKSKLLILDEPTVGMDLNSIDLFWQTLDHVAGSIVMVTHDFNQIDKFFTRVILLQDGHISEDIPVKTIHANNQTIAQWYRMHTTEDGEKA